MLPRGHEVDKERWEALKRKKGCPVHEETPPHDPPSSVKLPNSQRPGRKGIFMKTREGTRLCSWNRCGAELNNTLQRAGMEAERGVTSYTVGTRASRAMDVRLPRGLALGFGSSLRKSPRASADIWVEHNWTSAARAVPLVSATDEAHRVLAPRRQ